MDAKHNATTLPCGHRALYLAETPSTNSHAMELAARGAHTPLWVWAGRQTKGRGRLGRGWDSPQGNLYASMILRCDAPAGAIGGLPLLAGLAARDAIEAVSGGAPFAGRLRLKWPNDIMLDGAKLGGVLIESMVLDDRSRAVVIGTGLNLAVAPSDIGRAAVCVRDYGCEAGPGETLGALASATQRWLAVWANGSGFAAIRANWLCHADPLGAPISVKLGGAQIEGRFGGLDETGALRLRLGAGERLITAGDVAIGWGAPGIKAKAAQHE